MEMLNFTSSSLSLDITGQTSGSKAVNAVKVRSGAVITLETQNIHKLGYRYLL